MSTGEETNGMSSDRRGISASETGSTLDAASAVTSAVQQQDQQMAASAAALSDMHSSRVEPQLPSELHFNDMHSSRVELRLPSELHFNDMLAVEVEPHQAPPAHLLPHQRLASQCGRARLPGL